ncbi:nitroreductase family protein [Candidatus Roizmanbacteria bacterium]|nr:nitroreductase family protein [Candidatus Roizmanbacteria bacterium]
MKNKALINEIKSRRSIRKWKNKKVPKDLLKTIIDCGLSAPSAYGAQPWEIIVIEDKKIIEKLLSDRRQLKKPPYFINSAKYVDKLGKEKYEKVKPPPLMIVIAGDQKEYYGDTGGLIASLACCGENILLASHALGLGACWLFVRDDSMPDVEKEVKTILNIPSQHIVLGMLAVGYPDETALNKVLKSKKIHHNTW